MKMNENHYNLLQGKIRFGMYQAVNYDLIFQIRQPVIQNTLPENIFSIAIAKKIKEHK